LRAPAPPTTKVPPEMVTPPVNVLAPERVSVPLPVLVRPPPREAGSASRFWLTVMSKVFVSNLAPPSWMNALVSPLM